MLNDKIVLSASPTRTICLLFYSVYMVNYIFRYLLILNYTLKKKPVYQVGQWLAPESLGLGKAASILGTDKCGTYCTMWLILNSCFSSGRLELWYMLGRVLTGPAPSKNLGAEPLMSFPGGHSTCVVASSCGGN